MIPLYIALVTLDALILAVLVTQPGRWAAKAVAIVVAFAVNVTLLGVVPDTSGYASSSSPPDEAPFIACAVDEPTYVYLWLAPGDTPRAFRQPYSLDLHEACLMARRATAAGVRVGLRRVEAGSPGQPAPGRFVPYQLPPPGEVKS